MTFFVKHCRGFREDADNMTGTAEIDEHAPYFKDPRKAIREWADEMGIKVEYNIDRDMSIDGECAKSAQPVFVCTIITDYVVPELNDALLKGEGKGTRKKEAERNAALGVCAELQRLGLIEGSGKVPITTGWFYYLGRDFQSWCSCRTDSIHCVVVRIPSSKGTSSRRTRER
jgi:Double-stranded RNA binding motif